MVGESSPAKEVSGATAMKRSGVARPDRAAPWVRRRRRCRLECAPERAGAGATPHEKVMVAAAMGTSLSFGVP